MKLFQRGIVPVAIVILKHKNGGIVMKRFLCILLVTMMLVPCASAEGIGNLDISTLFGEKPIEEYTDSELNTMLLVLQFMESLIQAEIDSRSSVMATVAPRQRSTATPAPKTANSLVNKDGFTVYDDSGIKFKSAYIKKSGNTNKLVIVFDWANYGDSASSFGYKFSFEAYQDGIALSVGIIWDFDTQFTTKIQPGKILEGYYIWDLKDTKKTVTIVFDKFLDMSDSYPNTEFEIDLSKIETKK